MSTGEKVGSRTIWRTPGRLKSIFFKSIVLQRNTNETGDGVLHRFFQRGLRRGCNVYWAFLGLGVLRLCRGDSCQNRQDERKRSSSTKFMGQGSPPNWR